MNTSTMRKFIEAALLLLLVVNLSAVASALPDAQILQESPDGTYSEFVEDFQQLDNLTEEQLEIFFSRYSSLLTPSSETTKLSNTLTARPSASYPLETLKSEDSYTSIMAQLMTSQKRPHRILAYAVLSAANDHSFNTVLLQVIKDDQDSLTKTWAGIALLHLQDNHTSELFDFVVENDDFRDPHLTSLYLKLPADNIRSTAYEKADSQNHKARILVMKSLASTGLQAETEKVVREALKNWPPDTRRYALIATVHLGMSNLTDLLRPMAEEESLRGLVMRALANSPDTQDQDYLATLAQEPENLKRTLDAYLLSTRLESVRNWLKMIGNDKLPEDYIFFTIKQPLLQSDELLPEVLNALNTSRNAQTKASLVRALAGRSDSDSVELLVSLLSHEDSSVRYWSAEALEGVNSPLIAERLPALIKNPGLRTSALTSLVIDHELRNLQDVYLPLLQGDSHQDWRRSSAEYLAVYPGNTEASVFRDALQTEKDVFTRRTITIALAKVGAESDSELIENALKMEPPSDLNAVKYLIALAILKGERAHKILESYLDSPDETIREFVRERLENW